MKMYMNSTDNSANHEPAHGSSSSSPRTSHLSHSAAPRFSLRKRSFRDDASNGSNNGMNLASYNSDFLSGLFADVAKANVLSELRISTHPGDASPTHTHKRSCDLISPSTASSLDAAGSPAATTAAGTVEVGTVTPTADTSKRRKRCLGLHMRSSINARQSTRNLQMLCEQPLPQLQSASSVAPAPGIASDSSGKAQGTLQRQSSLAYQLQCVSSASSDSAETAMQDQAAQSSSSSSDAFTKPKTSIDIVEIAFPNLPATVSESSYSQTRLATGSLRARSSITSVAAAVANATSAAAEEPKDSFGWFVDLDEPFEEPRLPSNDTNNNLHHHSSLHRATRPLLGQNALIPTDDLAFQAPTAPKRVNDEAEIEWAQAADTVDDVLGDFF